MPSVSLTALLYVSRAGIHAQQTSLDVTANNIANINTVGFKRSRAEFHELLNERLEEPAEESNRVIGDAAGVIMADAPHIFNQGVIEHSEYEWDLAIDGEGFFQVQLADGSQAYTRDGTFRLDGEGQLVNADGYAFMPAIILPPDTEETMISGDGEVFVRRTGEVEPQVIATIELTRFSNPSGLEAVGQNLFIPSDASGAAEVGQSGADGFGVVISHATEKSNVDLSSEVVDMISAQRAYTLMTRALKTTDEMIGLATQLR